jgi:hypothetical protein
VGLMLLTGSTPVEMRELSSNVRHDEPRASHLLQRGVCGEEASRQTYLQQHQAETKSVSISSILALAEYELI